MNIQGYPNYVIHRDGNVENIDTGRILIPTQKPSGYYRIGLCKNCKVKHFYRSRLLAIAYIPNPENKPFVDHINRKPWDDRLENLRWATRSENNINSKVKHILTRIDRIHMMIIYDHNMITFSKILYFIRFLYL